MKMDGKTRREIILQKLLIEQLKVNPDNLYRPRKGDIFVVGPAKSGTTWMQQILHQLRIKGDENFDDIYRVSLWVPNPKIHGGDLNLNNDQEYNPRVYKHHEMYGTIPMTNGEQKHVVIVRNPYDAAFSYVKFLGRFYGCEQDLSDEECAKIFTDTNEIEVEPNFKTMATWFEHKDDPNVLYVFYEDLKKDLSTMIRMVANFVEIPVTDEELARVTGFCTFEYMSKHKEKFQGETLTNFIANLANIETWKPAMGLVREDGGQIGQGVQKIGPKLKAVVDQLWKENLGEKFGYKTYEEMYKDNSVFKQHY